MKRSTRWMVAIWYYYSQIIGILTFSYDLKTGRAYKKIWGTLYSALMSLVMFSAVSIVARFNPMPNEASLNIYISTMMSFLQIIAILITVAMNWIRRNDFIRTVNDFRDLRTIFVTRWQISEKLQKYYEDGIRRKLICGFLSDSFMLSASFDTLKKAFDVEDSLAGMGLGLLSSVLSIVICHYYFTIHNINVALAQINEEVQKILNDADLLSRQQHNGGIRPGAFVSQCCKLSDDLDELARYQYKFQNLAQRINYNYDIQGACVVFSIYLTNMNVIYMLYMILKHNELSQKFSQFAWIVVIDYLFFYLDLKSFLSSLLDMQSIIKNTSVMLNTLQSGLPTLDQRLEQSLKTFSLQLASFPMEVKLMGLFELDSSMVFATLSSTVSSAIVLIQNDYKNSKL